ncbi:hypothetical protein FH972_023108 [Carpinus fangiana]|uniref:SH3 domain-containing protein n=1 Tax=Carpinus fangiana TaxID=176857 RepID=A0A5N6KU76_9ROSI|nr:hypothetical protein FH972_023108 [Carpinus fangiana]
MPWRPLDRIAFAICTYPYVPSHPSDLPLQIGDELYIIEQGGKDGAWYRGYLVAPPSLLAGLTSNQGQALEARVFSGIFPRDCVEVRELLGDAIQPKSTHNLKGSVNGVSNGDAASAEEQNANGHAEPARKPPAPVPMLKIGDESVLAKEEPLVDEIASCLREWHNTKLHDLLLNGQYENLEQLSVLVDRLDTTRRQLLHKLLTREELDELRQDAIWDLVNGNKMLEQDVIVRSTDHKGAMLTGNDSAIDISKLQSLMSLLDARPTVQDDTRTLHHLLVNLADYSVEGDKGTSFGLCLYSKTAGQEAKLLSELFAVETALEPAAKGVETKTLFTDLSSGEVGDSSSSNTKIFLVVKMVTKELVPSTTAEEPDTPVSSGGLSPDPAPLNTGLGARLGTVKGNRVSMMWGGRSPKPANSTRLLVRPDTSASGRSGSQEPPRSSAGTSVQKPAEDKPVKKTTGVGVIDITDIFKSSDPYDRSIAIRSVTTSKEDPNATESELDDIVSDIYGNREDSRFTTATRVVVNLKAFEGLDSEQLVQNTPTLLHGVGVTKRIGFAGAPNRPRTDIYLTLSSPHVPPNAIIAHPKFGSEPVPDDLRTDNLKLTLEVRNSSGERIKHCIFPSSNSSGHTAWRTTAVAQGESWNQTIRINLDPADVPGCHVVMSIADGFGFPFGLSHIPLWTQEAFVRDGNHSLTLYKYDEYTANPGSSRGGYLALQWNSKAQDEAVTGPLALLRVQTFLCSTMHSQDPNLLALLKWREQGSKGILSILMRFGLVPGIEIVKLLEDVLDAIFELIVEYAGNDEIEERAFDALVMTLGIVHDRRFNVQPLVDEYAAHKFIYPFAFPCLMRSLTRLLGRPQDSDIARRVRATCKLGGHILRFVVKARQQQIQKEVGIGITSHQPTFAKDLRDIFAGIDAVMNNSDPVVLGTKTLLVQNFHTWLAELIGVMTEDEMLAVVANFVNSLARAQGKLVLYKLLLVQNLCSTQLFKDENVLRHWRSLVLDWLAPHWGYAAQASPQLREQVRLCCSVVSLQASSFGSNTAQIVRKLVQSYTLLQDKPRSGGEPFTFLFPTQYPFPSKSIKSTDYFDEALIEIAALLSLLSINNSAELLDLPKEELSVLIMDTLKVHESVHASKAFPSSWLSLRIYHHKASLTALQAIYKTLSSNFLPEPEDGEDFDSALWREFLIAVLQLVGSDALVIESFSEQRRRAVWKIGGDLREEGAELLRRTWSALGWEASPEEKSAFALDRLGGYQVSYVPELVGPVVELCLSVHESLRSVAIGVLQSMIVGEWTLNQNLDLVQVIMIECLDHLLEERRFSDGATQKLFVAELRTRFGKSAKNRDDEFLAAATRLLDTIDELLELLISVHGNNASGDSFHIMDALRLMNFLKDVQKEDIYVQYVHKLATIQEASQNPTEAGLALKLHADLYDWDQNTTVPAIPQLNMPAQAAFERKEKLYFQLIALFEDGAAYRLALKAYQELARQYEEVTFDFAKLARTQRAMATLNEKVTRSDPQSARFFRVIFRGLGFSPALRDKQFIFEGRANDRQASFTERMQKQYPQAQVINGSHIEDYEGQYISIHAVSVQKNLLHAVNRRLRIAQSTKDHYMLAEPRHFTTTSRRQASTTGVKDQILEKMLFTTTDSFPNVLGRSEIMQIETVSILPVQIGVERTIRKTHDLYNLQNSVLGGDEGSLAVLTEELKILVRPESSGNVAKYWTLLLPSPVVDEENGEVEDIEPGLTQPCSDPLDEALRVALIDHVLTIRSCLDLFPQSTHSLVRADLNKNFEKTFSDIIETVRLAIPGAIVPDQQPAQEVQAEEAANRADQPAAASPEPVVLSGAQEVEQRHTRNESSAVHSTYTTATVGDKAVSGDKSKEAHRLSVIRNIVDDGFTLPKETKPSPKIVSPNATAEAKQAPEPAQNNLQARVGSMSKRLSSINIGRRRMMRLPAVGSVAEQ